MSTVLSEIASYWTEWVWPILQFIIGLGLMVFVHELGHFLVAKWVGIRVERFAIGMGPRLLGFKPGETDYCLCAVPLGGYVKMTGQEDFKPLKEGDKPDPRSYEAKSVGRRFAVISAGVIMNLILAAVLFVIIGLVGMDFAAPVVGGTAPGSPASQAPIAWKDPVAATLTTSKGLKPGDTLRRIAGPSIVQWICGDRIEHFQDVVLTSALADPEDTYTFTIERNVGGRTLIGTASMKPKADDRGVRFGVAPATNLVFGEADGLIVDTPYRKNDRLLKINGTKVEHHWDIKPIEKGLSGDPVTVTVRRHEGADEDIQVRPSLALAENVIPLKDGTVLRGKFVDSGTKEIQKTLPSGKTEPKTVAEFTIDLANGTGTRAITSDDMELSGFRMLGMMPRMRITAVMEGKPADDAGVKPGDVIQSYGGTKHPTVEQLREISDRVEDQPTELVVLRGGAEQALRVMPAEKGGRFLIGVHHVADLDHATVAGVREGSAADKAGIPAGAVLKSINGVDVGSWYDVYHILSAEAGKTVRIAYAHGDADADAEIELTHEAFQPGDFRWRVFDDSVGFETLMQEIKQDGAVASLAWGGKVTVKQVLSSYLAIRGLIRGWVPLNQSAGPIGIGTIAVKVGRKSFIEFLYFLGIISAAIAVFNFLPFPVVDGGHAVFLLIEKIRGKPLSVKVMNYVQATGLIMLLGVFVLVTWNDIMRLVDWSW